MPEPTTDPLAALGPEITARRQMAAELDRVAAGEVHGRREMFDASIPPGGYVCAEPDPEMPDGICGMPVEDVPCTVHHPAAGGQP